MEQNISKLPRSTAVLVALSLSLPCGILSQSAAASPKTPVNEATQYRQDQKAAMKQGKQKVKGGSRTLPGPYWKVTDPTKPMGGGGGGGGGGTPRYR